MTHKYSTEVVFIVPQIAPTPTFIPDSLLLRVTGDAQPKNTCFAYDYYEKVSKINF